ncbi:MAG: LolA family protein [Desulfomonilia bacterium]
MKNSLILLVILFVFAVDIHASTLEEIQARYSGYRDFVVSFSQDTVQILANRTVHFTGTLSYKRDMGVRMDVYVPQRQVIILMEETVVIHLPEEGTSTVQEIPKEIAAQNILGFFTGLISLDEVYEVNEAGDALVLTPRNGTGSMSIWTDERNLLRKLIFRDATGNSSEITLDGYAFDTGLSDDLFLFEFAPSPDE